MASRIRLFDRSGILLYEAGAPAFRDWIINDIGNANFTIKAHGLEKYVAFGNYITIEHDKLDTWVGVVTTPRPWDARVITVNAKSVMWMFGQRVGNYKQPVSGSWGAVFSQIIAVVNNAELTPLQIGAYDDGVVFSSVVDMSNVYTYLQRALTQSGTRLDFRPVIVDGKLTIYADLEPTLYTTSDLRLEEGLNIKEGTSVLIEQGEIYNDVTILAIGLQQNRFTARAVNTQSIEKYGLRQILFSEGQSQADVDRLAVIRLAQYDHPRATLGLVAMDQENTFPKLRLGNSAAVELKSKGYLNNGFGFRGTTYIRVIQFDDRTGEATLVCQEI